MFTPALTPHPPLMCGAHFSGLVQPVDISMAVGRGAHCGSAALGGPRAGCARRQAVVVVPPGRGRASSPVLCSAGPWRNNREGHAVGLLASNPHAVTLLPALAPLPSTSHGIAPTPSTAGAPVALCARSLAATGGGAGKDISGAAGEMALLGC
jgi:hypothetical protein